MYYACECEGEKIVFYYDITFKTDVSNSTKSLGMAIMQISHIFIISEKYCLLHS